MRCGCPQCGAFMIHSERDNACVCPDCLYRCYACQGTGTALTHEMALEMKHMNEQESAGQEALIFPGASAAQELPENPAAPLTMEERMRRAREREDE